MLSFFNGVIRWNFYLLFFFVPIIFTGNTSELFEFNKMWLTFGLTLIIAAAWIGKACIERQIKIVKTPLDIPILLFLATQVISTIFSIDPHTSLWGYYSRFNGGLYSLFAYGFLYFAFVSNIEVKNVMKYAYTGIASAVFVALWGLPSHFGYDPTCLIFRGTFDVSCWTFAFQPKVRIFSTLGQPDWLAAYLAFSLMIAIGLGIAFWNKKEKLIAGIFAASIALFYADLLYTKSRSGFGAVGAGIVIFTVIYIVWYWKSFAKRPIVKALKQNTYFLLVIALLAVVTFLVGAPVSPLDKFSLNGIQTIVSEQKTVTKELSVKTPVAVPTPTTAPTQEFGGTDSGKIRLFVWQGAIQIFLHNPLIGTGVETFGYAYYQFRPAGHNLTSEWDYLYNKAHNEFLNYLATTGIFGFGTYMILLIMSLWIMGKAFWKIIHEEKGTEKNELFSFAQLQPVLFLAIITGYLTILITNFFGFSVVIMNIYLFLAPAFVLLLSGIASDEKTYALGTYNKTLQINEIGWVGIGVAWLLCIYFIVVLVRFWIADTQYAYGQNLDHANQYQAAYSYLHDAVATRPSEPTFQDELSIDDAVLSTALFQQKDSINGAKLRDEAIAFSDKVTTEHPNVVTFWKDRVRVFYTLAQVDPHYLSYALAAIQKAASLAPSDAKVWYNLGLLYDQTGDINTAINTMQQTVVLKSDYRDAYYALALFYRQKALGGDITSTRVKDKVAEQKAVDIMHYILKNLETTDDLKINATLASWGEK